MKRKGLIGRNDIQNAYRTVRIDLLDEGIRRGKGLTRDSRQAAATICPRWGQYPIQHYQTVKT